LLHDEQPRLTAGGSDDDSSLILHGLCIGAASALSELQKLVETLADAGNAVNARSPSKSHSVDTVLSTSAYEAYTDAHDRLLALCRAHVKQACVSTVAIILAVEDISLSQFVTDILIAFDRNL
jgi:hypothetical protein